jgi:hypothetical protein
MHQHADEDPFEGNDGLGTEVLGVATMAPKHGAVVHQVQTAESNAHVGARRVRPGRATSFRGRHARVHIADSDDEVEIAHVAPAGALRLRMCVLDSDTLKSVWGAPAVAAAFAQTHSGIVTGSADTVLASDKQPSLASDVPAADATAGNDVGESARQPGSKLDTAVKLPAQLDPVLQSERLHECFAAWRSPPVQGQRGCLFIKVRSARLQTYQGLHTCPAVFPLLGLQLCSTSPSAMLHAFFAVMVGKLLAWIAR